MQRNIVQIFALLMFIMCPLYAEAKFDFVDVVKQAEDLALQEYEAPQPVPQIMLDMSYDTHRNIRFDPEKSLWRQSKSKFQVMLVPPGRFFTHGVKLNVVDSEGIKPIPSSRDNFTFDDPEVERRVPTNMGIAGFKLTFPLNSSHEQNQFLVFAGASYFRAVGKDNWFGISGRGLAIDTGLSTGEEFPAFTEFWLVRPSPDANEMVFYGLLDSPSLTGAYQFTAVPGSPTRLRVKMTLFPRKEIKLVGVAPLTSMFFYGDNTARPRGEWRRQVHDSDGLQIHDGVNDEWLWRPLLNPKTLEMDYFMTENVRGFGLEQRDVIFSDYEDLNARYEQRPTTWVEPQGEWGKGHIVLVQLPTNDETNDNIVAFWSPQSSVTPETSLSYSYHVNFGESNISQNPMGTVVNTFIGDGNRIGGGAAPGAYRIIVDFEGGKLDKLSADAPISSHVTGLEGSEILEHYVIYNEAINGWRLSILAKHVASKPLHLRAFLRNDQYTLTETWTYRLPANNNILPEGK